MTISGSSMLGLILLGHMFADYTLQGCLANLKQKAWWDKQLENVPNKGKYRNDYRAGLVCHSLYWSLIVCLPLLMAGGNWYLANAAVHGLAHYVVDDMKANKLAINLVQDQLLHMAQLLAVWAVWNVAC